MNVKEVDFLGECGFRADFLRAKNQKKVQAAIGMPPDAPAFTFGATPPPPVFPVPRNKEEADLRSVSVGQVDYSAKPEDLSNAFASCGTVNRVTILRDKFDNPKGFAYIEFLEPDAVSNAILLDGTEVCGRKIKVWQKRSVLSAKGAAKPTNVDVNIHDVVPVSYTPPNTC